MQRGGGLRKSDSLEECIAIGQPRRQSTDEGVSGTVGRNSLNAVGGNFPNGFALGQHQTVGTKGQDHAGDMSRQFEGRFNRIKV